MTAGTEATAGAFYGAAEFQNDTGVSRETLDRLTAYVDLLETWQKKINLIGPKTLSQVWRRHILDSAQIMALIRHPPGGRIAAEEGAGPPRILIDLGSGAGFPGLVLAVMDREAQLPLEVHLIESDQRKCVFLREAARIAEVEVTVHETRAEDLTPFTADIITARACAPLDRLLGYAHRFWGPGTTGLFHKGQDVEKELVQATKSWSMVTQLCPSRSDPSGFIVSVNDLLKGGA